MVLTIFLIFQQVQGYSLLDRVYHKNDIRNQLPDFRTSDADVGIRSHHFVGTFRGNPIKTRQNHVFIDDNGVPIPLLPFHDFSKESPEPIKNSQLMAHHLNRQHKLRRLGAHI
ncbi:unnamed protein product [Caenorhabditis angaria]|uniref:Uncharacterized protein n=1 Tax=Caenorhabditis angaria TaxID=860376 RepID=A0A9P1MVU1_9PELO|nr:unnamed protein product [Caenorhabditis angaria]